MITKEDMEMIAECSQGNHKWIRIKKGFTSRGRYLYVYECSCCHLLDCGFSE